MTPLHSKGLYICSLFLFMPNFNTKLNILRTLDRKELKRILKELYLGEKFTPREIGNIFDTYEEIIRAQLKIFNIPLRNKKRAWDILLKNKGYSNLTEREKQIILGGALGDGGLHVRNINRNANYSEDHKKEHKEYVEWKARELGTTVKIRWKYEKREGGEFKYKKGWYKQYGFCLKKHPFLTYIHKELYVNGKKKKVTLNFLNKLSPLGLAVWYMDDGCYKKQGKIVSLSTGLEDVETIQSYFEYKYGLYSKKYKDRTIFVIYFTVSDSKKFIELVKEHIMPIKCMRYKIGE